MELINENLFLNISEMGFSENWSEQPLSSRFK